MPCSSTMGCPLGNVRVRPPNIFVIRSGDICPHHQALSRLLQFVLQARDARLPRASNFINETTVNLVKTAFQGVDAWRL